MSQLSRRDFLKLAGAYSGGLILSSVRSQSNMELPPTDSRLPTIIMIVLDAMTAENLSIYEYHRNTTPNFKRFAERATVYHQHYSAGNYTVPGTASLLTGMYPWTHRALNLSGLVARDLVSRNIFTLLGPRYQRFAYSQNIAVNHLLNQFANSIETYLPPGKFSVAEQIIGEHFVNDLSNAYRAYEEFLTTDNAIPGSLLFGAVNQFIFHREAAIAQSLSNEYPAGLPRTTSNSIYFRLKDVFDGLRDQIIQLKSPSFAYFHLWSPHSPYRPTKEYIGIYKDNWRPVKKPSHPYGSGVPQSHLNTRRLHYDEYIANVDAEFGVLFDSLIQNGILDNSYVILTSDHGESFERGVDGHITPLLYEPLIHIPLIISAPGQRMRHDIFSPTTSVDILPSLLNLSGLQIPPWCEGQPLPGLGGLEQSDRSIFSVEAKNNPAFSPLTSVSIMLRRGRYKMIYYTGHPIEDTFELYDIEDDQEEMNDQYSSLKSIASSMREELLDNLAYVNHKYQS